MDTVINDPGYGAGANDAAQTRAARWSRFQSIWEIDGRETQETILRKLLAPNRQSHGLQCLAELVRDGYFDFILSTNIDDLLERYVIRAGVPLDQFVVTYAHIMRREVVEDVFTRKQGKYLVKLHGHIGHREWAFSDREIYRFTARSAVTPSPGQRP